MGGITSDAWVRDTVQSRLSLEFLSTFPRFFICCLVPKDKDRRILMDSIVNHLLEIRVILKVPEDQLGQRFYSLLFIVPKSSGGWRPILDLKRLN